MLWCHLRTHKVNVLRLSVHPDTLTSVDRVAEGEGAAVTFTHNQAVRRGQKARDTFSALIAVKLLNSSAVS